MFQSKCTRKRHVERPPYGSCIDVWLREQEARRRKGDHVYCTAYIVRGWCPCVGHLIQPPDPATCSITGMNGHYPLAVYYDQEGRAVC